MAKKLNRSKNKDPNLNKYQSTSESEKKFHERFREAIEAVDLSSIKPVGSPIFNSVDNEFGMTAGRRGSYPRHSCSLEEMAARAFPDIPPWADDIPTSQDEVLGGDRRSAEIKGGIGWDEALDMARNHDSRRPPPQGGILYGKGSRHGTVDISGKPNETAYGGASRGMTDEGVFGRPSKMSAGMKESLSEAINSVIGNMSPDDIRKMLDKMAYEFRKPPVLPDSIETDEDGNKYRIIDAGCVECGGLRFAVDLSPIYTDVPHTNDEPNPMKEILLFGEPRSGYECKDCGHITGVPHDNIR